MLKNGAPLEQVKSTFFKIIIENDRSEKNLVETPDTLGHIWGVKELSAFELLYLAQMANSSKKTQDPLEKIKEARLSGSISD